MQRARSKVLQAAALLVGSGVQTERPEGKQSRIWKPQVGQSSDVHDSELAPQHGSVVRAAKAIVSSRGQSEQGDKKTQLVAATSGQTSLSAGQSGQSSLSTQIEQARSNLPPSIAEPGGMVLNMLAKFSKENPELLEMVEKIINDEGKASIEEMRTDLNRLLKVQPEGDQRTAAAPEDNPATDTAQAQAGEVEQVSVEVVEVEGSGEQQAEAPGSSSSTDTDPSSGESVPGQAGEQNHEPATDPVVSWHHIDVSESAEQSDELTSSDFSSDGSWVRSSDCEGSCPFTEPSGSEETGPTAVEQPGRVTSLADTLDTNWEQVDRVEQRRSRLQSGGGEPCAQSPVQWSQSKKEGKRLESLFLGTPPSISKRFQVNVPAPPAPAPLEKVRPRPRSRSLRSRSHTQGKPCLWRRVQLSVSHFFKKLFSRPRGAMPSTTSSAGPSGPSSAGSSGPSGSSQGSSGPSGSSQGSSGPSSASSSGPSGSTQGSSGPSGPSSAGSSGPSGSSQGSSGPSGSSQGSSGPSVSGNDTQGTKSSSADDFGDDDSGMSFASAMKFVLGVLVVGVMLLRIYGRC